MPRKTSILSTKRHQNQSVNELTILICLVADILVEGSSKISIGIFERISPQIIRWSTTSSTGLEKQKNIYQIMGYFKLSVKENKIKNYLKNKSSEAKENSKINYLVENFAW